MTHGPLMFDLLGTELSAEERDMLRHPAAGGVILFTRNYESPEQIAALITEIHAQRTPTLLVAVDHEGGRVQRFRDGFTRLPPAAWFGELQGMPGRHAYEMAQTAGWLMAAELRSVGVDFSFAPVLDLGLGVSSVIGDRAFHAKPAIVAELAHAWMQGVHEAGMAAVGKHFPGHGGVAADSHIALPVDHRRYQDLLVDDLFPFRRMIDYGLEAIMPAHVIYPEADPQLAGFSSFWLKRVLRGELGFQGVIFSDDLTMAAAGEAGDYPERARAALEAGCDMVLCCNHREGAQRLLGALQDHRDPAAQSRMLRMHGRRTYNRNSLHHDPRWHKAVRAVAEYEETARALSLNL